MLVITPFSVEQVTGAIGHEDFVVETGTPTWVSILIALGAILAIIAAIVIFQILRNRPLK